MVTVAQLNELKEKVKTEMLRRSGYGDISKFGGSEYDFIRAPAVGEPILEEHGKKSVDLILQVKDKDNMQFVRKGDGIPSGFNESLISYVEDLSKEPMEGNQSSCRGACTGLCAASCTEGCDGCAGNCTGICSGCGGCGGCEGDCTAGCGTTCTGTCSNCTSCTGGASK